SRASFLMAASNVASSITGADGPTVAAQGSRSHVWSPRMWNGCHAALTWDSSSMMKPGAVSPTGYGWSPLSHPTARTSSPWPAMQPLERSGYHVIARPSPVLRESTRKSNGSVDSPNREIRSELGDEPCWDRTSDPLPNILSYTAPHNTRE